MSEAICMSPGPSESLLLLLVPVNDEAPLACEGGAAKLGEIMLAAACMSPPDPEPLDPPPKKFLRGDDELDPPVDDEAEDDDEPAEAADEMALAIGPAAFCIPCDANIPGLNNGRSVVDDAPPKNDWNACIANELGADDDDPDDESPESDEEPPVPAAVEMMLAKGDEPRADISGDGELLAAGSSSSPKKLLMADMAGLRPAMARGVSSSDGIKGAEKSKPSPSGFDRRPDAMLPRAVACLSVAGRGRTKKGAWSGTAP